MAPFTAAWAGGIEAYRFLWAFRPRRGTRAIVPWLRIEGSATTTRHTSVWKGLLVAVFSLYRYIGDGGIDRRKILHDGTHRSRTDLLPFWGDTPGAFQVRNFGHKF